MTAPAVRIEGLNPLVRRLKVLDAELPNEVKRINRGAAESVVPVALGLVPRLTGRLAGTIKAGATRRAAYIAAGWRTDPPYAAPIHFGWPARNIEPQPFLAEALGWSEERIKADYERNLDALIQRVGL